MHLHVAEAREPSSTEGDGYREGQKQRERNHGRKMTELSCNTLQAQIPTNTCGSGSKQYTFVSCGVSVDIVLIVCLVSIAIQYTYSSIQY